MTNPPSAQAALQALEDLVEETREGCDDRTRPLIDTISRFIEGAEMDAIARLSGNGVLVRLDRQEGYEDVHPQLVAEDAIGDNWPSYETLTQPAARSAEQKDKA
jgi:hypothetical protein